MWRSITPSAPPTGDDQDVFFLVAVALLLFLPSPWDLVGFTIALLVALGETLFWHRTVKGRRAAVGVENVIGSEARVLSACRPTGQVHLNGEIWEARCTAGVDPGQKVRVVGRRGLTLVVEQM
jgi:membrane-bound serine protease (ClpP class)